MCVCPHKGNKYKTKQVHKQIVARVFLCSRCRMLVGCAASLSLDCCVLFGQGRDMGVPRGTCGCHCKSSRYGGDLGRGLDPLLPGKRHSAAGARTGCCAPIFVPPSPLSSSLLSSPLLSSSLLFSPPCTSLSPISRFFILASLPLTFACCRVWMPLVAALHSRSSWCARV